MGRSVCALGLIERPLALALGWWALGGGLHPALELGIFFELFWLDLFAAGSFIPPMPAFPLLVLLALSHSLALTQAGELLVPLAALLPLAYLPVIMERRIRQTAGVRAHVRLLRESVRPCPQERLTHHLIARAALKLLVFLLPAFYLVYALGLILFPVLTPAEPTRLFPAGWEPLLLTAALGGFLALRLRQARLLCLCVLLGLALLGLC